MTGPSHQCGYWSTFRSNVANARGLTEKTVNDLLDYGGNKRLSEREKAALHYSHRATRPAKACSQPEQPLPEYHGLVGKARAKGCSV